MAATYSYITDGKTKNGPVTLQQLTKLADTGKLKPVDMVREDGAGKWRPAGEIAGLFTDAGDDEPAPSRRRKVDQDSSDSADGLDEDFVSSLPEEVASLGTPTAVFYYSRFWFLFLLIFGVLIFLFGVFLIALYFFLQAYPPQKPVPGTAIHWIGVASPFLLLGLFLVAYGFNKKRQHFLIFPKALVKLKGGKASIWPWQDVSVVYQHYLNPSMMYGNKVWITMNDGKKIVVEDMRNQAALADKIQAAVTRELLPAAIKAVEAGKTMTFGDLELAETGLVYKESELAWDDIDQIEFTYDSQRKRTSMTVSKRRKSSTFCTIHTHKVPNIGLLLKLLERVDPPLKITSSIK